MIALTLSPLEDLSVLASMGEPENEIYLTDEMFSGVCHLPPILYEKKDFGRSAVDLRAHLYDHLRVICVVCHLQKTH